jgi:hypothetical protein
VRAWTVRSAAGFGFLALSGVSFYVWNVAARTGPPPPEHSRAAGAAIASATGPLFRLGNPYVDARSAWFRARFDADLERALAEGPAGAPRAAAKVHRSPFTSGPALASLGPDLDAYRAEVESQTVESSFSFQVEGVDAVRVLLYLVFGNVHASMEGIGTVERQNHLPPIEGPLPGLDPPPVLTPSQFLCHERRRPAEPLARPTSLYYACQVERSRGALVLRYETLRNTGDESHVPLHIDSGQYVIEEESGAVSVTFLCFYSGQRIPPFLEGIAEGITRDSYIKFAEAVRRLAPAWTVPEEAAAWARRTLRVEGPAGR